MEHNWRGNKTQISDLHMCMYIYIYTLHIYTHMLKIPWVYGTSLHPGEYELLGHHARGLEFRKQRILTRLLSSLRLTLSSVTGKLVVLFPRKWTTWKDVHRKPLIYEIKDHLVDHFLLRPLPELAKEKKRLLELSNCVLWSPCYPSAKP